MPGLREWRILKAVGSEAISGSLPPFGSPEATSAGPAWKDVLQPEERRELLRVRSWRGLLSLATDWGLIFAFMGLVAAAPGLWKLPAIVIALFGIGARQLGLAVMMHDAAHRALLANRRWNDLVGNWLAAYPIWADLHTYRPYHLRHHAKNWTPEDPDLGLATPFPITRASLWRKVGRDLSGRTGLKFARFAWKRDMGGKTAEERRAGRVRFLGMLATNAALLAVLALAGHPELYALWVGSWLTTYTLVTRFRSIAEHSMPEDPADELRNTRTTHASWWERLFLAPNRVNYHLEHHLLMTVPHYNLPRLHRILRERGALERALLAPGYIHVLRQASSRAA